MGYRFRGFFSDGDEAVMAAALIRWPFCKAKSIVTPFKGFGLRGPDPENEADSDEEHDQLVELSFEVERDLVEFSRDFPKDTFVFIDADCFGGRCCYTGYVVRGGEILLREETTDELSIKPLQRLLKHLGVKLWFGYFIPFTREYW